VTDSIHHEGTNATKGHKEDTDAAHACLNLLVPLRGVRVFVV